MWKWTILAICLASNAHAQDFYRSGQEFLDSSEVEQLAYTMGAYDALLASGTAPWFEQCTKGWKVGQTTAVLAKYFKDHPELRNYDAADQLPISVAKVCPSAPKEFRHYKK